MNARVWKSRFIVELYKEILPLFSLFLKMLEILLFDFLLTFNVRGEKVKKKLHFIPIKTVSLLSTKKMRMLTPKNETVTPGPTVSKGMHGHQENKDF